MNDDLLRGDDSNRPHGILNPPVQRIVMNQGYDLNKWVPIPPAEINGQMWGIMSLSGHIVATQIASRVLAEQIIREHNMMPSAMKVVSLAMRVVAEMRVYWDTIPISTLDKLKSSLEEVTENYGDSSHRPR